METIQCSCESGNEGIFPCTGAANVGQLSNEAAYCFNYSRGCQMRGNRIEKVLP
jgi:uncharacterized metal-binding protein